MKSEMREGFERRRRQQPQTLRARGEERGGEERGGEERERKNLFIFNDAVRRRRRRRRRRDMDK